MEYNIKENAENFIQDLASQYNEVSLYKAYAKHFDEVLSANKEKTAFECIDFVIRDFESKFDELLQTLENDLINEIESMRDLGIMKY